MKTRTVRLDSVCERIDYGFTASADFSIREPRLLRITDIQNGAVDWNHVPGCKITPEDEAEKRLCAGDIVFARTGATTGKCFLIRHAPRAVFASYLIRLRATDEVLPPYLYAFFQSEHYWSQITGAVRGAAQGGVNSTTLSSLVLPLPEVTEQRRIAKELEEADRLVRTRRYSLELADTFLPGAFLKLFGDPVSNPRGWERARVCELGDVETGNTPPREIADYYGSAIEWIKSDNISLARMHPSVATEGLSEKGIKVGRTVDPGSLLLTCIAGSETSIGNVVLMDRRVAFNQQINAVTPHRDVDPQFLYGLFLAAKPMIQRNTTLAMKRMITKGKLEELLLVKPPQALQQKFAAVVERVERLRAVHREALRQAEHLFASLLDQAFSGLP